MRDIGGIFRAIAARGCKENVKACITMADLNIHQYYYGTYVCFSILDIAIIYPILFDSAGSKVFS